MARGRTRKPRVAHAFNSPETTPQGAHGAPREGIYLEIGGVRIHVEQPGQLQALLPPLLRVTNQKSLAHWLGISPRTYRRWRQTGKVPPLEGKTLAQVLQQMATLPASAG